MSGNVCTGLPEIQRPLVVSQCLKMVLTPMGVAVIVTSSPHIQIISPVTLPSSGGSGIKINSFSSCLKKAYRRVSLINTTLRGVSSETNPPSLSSQRTKE